MNSIPSYEINISKTNTKSIRFLFESTGIKSIVKAVEYAPFKVINGTTLYNLGFGDFNEQDGSLIDDINSNNGDMRRVFSTVLDTVPKFFLATKNAALWVQGSDSEKAFMLKCKLSCTKKCTDTCKNQGRRIKAYRYFVDKHYEALCKEYLFYGLSSNDNQTIVEYMPNNTYQGILVFKKKIN